MNRMDYGRWNEWDGFWFVNTTNMEWWLDNVIKLTQLKRSTKTQTRWYNKMVTHNTDLHNIFLKIREIVWSYRKWKKKEIWRRLGQVMAKNLLAQTISDTMFGTNIEIQQNHTG